MGGGKVRRCRHQRGTAGLHIQRAHAVKPVAVQLAVGIAGPAAAPLHGVQVAVQADDRAGEGAGEEGKNVFAVKIRHFGVVVLVQLRGKAVTAKPVRGKVHDVILVKILTFNGYKLLQKLGYFCFRYHFRILSFLLRERKNGVICHTV